MKSKHELLFEVAAERIIENFDDCSDVTKYFCEGYMAAAKYLYSEDLREWYLKLVLS